MKKILNTFFQVLVKKHENSRNFNVLKTLSRLTGLLVCGIVTLIPEISGFNALSFVITVILMDFAFLVSPLKESSFKTPEFFKENKCTPQSLDRYTMTMVLLKLVLAIPITTNFLGVFAFTEGLNDLFGVLFMGSFFPVPWIVAYFTKYNPYMPDGKHPVEKPWYYGKGGFGMAGNYTGKLGSVGGQSG
ncbi:MAG: hypothetical protein O3C54_04460 [Proteobacteria bacterium]|nr:hypothetical protein [Pseudomonadota bacterium]